MMDHFDVVVIGSGSAGNTVANACNDKGLSVAVVDHDPFGGTCALRGCTPKKVLVGASTIGEHHRTLSEKGVFVFPAPVDWSGLVAFKREFTGPVTEARLNEYKQLGIRSFQGTARFISSSTMKVGYTSFSSTYFVIASGAMPRPLSFPGADHLVTNEGFLELDELPDRIVFVGGGYISFEFAHVAARVGADVTILHRSEQPLKQFDPVLVQHFVEASRGAGINVVVNAPVTGVDWNGDGYTVHTSGDQKEYAADLVVHGAGRAPQLNALDLAAGNVERSPRGVAVTNHLQSMSNEAVYAAGDAVGGVSPPLQPVAIREGQIVADNILNGNRSTIDYDAVPSILFGIPQMASVGHTEESAKKQGLNVVVREHDLSSWLSSRLLGNTHAWSRVIEERGSGRLLGAHIMAPQAGDMINVLTLAIKKGLHASDLQEAMFAFPTSTSDIPHIV